MKKFIKSFFIIAFGFAIFALCLAQYLPNISANAATISYITTSVGENETSVGINYQRFKDCLLKPRNIADYIKEPKKTTIIYTIIVLIIYIIPFILITLLSKSDKINRSINSFALAKPPSK